MLRKRVEVLFETSAYRQLEERARAEERSVGALIREAVAKYCLAPSEEERRAAFRWLRSQEMDIDSDWEKVKEEIAEARYQQIIKSLETD